MSFEKGSLLFFQNENKKKKINIGNYKTRKFMNHYRKTYM